MQKRKEFIQQCKKNLGRWRSILEDLRSDIERGDPGLDDEQGRQLQDLGSHFEDIEELVRSLEMSDEDEWDDLKDALIEEIETFEESLLDIRERVEDV